MDCSFCLQLENDRSMRRKKIGDRHHQGRCCQNQQSTSSVGWIKKSLPTLLFSLACFSSLGIVFADDSDHNFCGSSWGHASADCGKRQHCPNGSDEECPSGLTCWADTSCDASLGHGSELKYASLMTIPYEDPSNKKFCGTWYGDANDKCSLKTHCPTGQECAENSGETCQDTSCHAHDLILAEIGEDGLASLLTGDDKKLGEDAEDKKPGKVTKLDENDPRRHNFCGISWGSANAECSKACPGGEDTDCPDGLGCFGHTSCYYDDDLQPTLAPTTLGPTLTPTTYKPTSTKAPVTRSPVLAIGKFCGLTWSSAISSCSLETLCENDGDCNESETCFGDLPGCTGSSGSSTGEQNTDSTTTQQNTPTPLSRDDASNFRFCGVSWAEADNNCDLDTHCPDGTSESCPDGFFCLSVSDKCNAYDMIHKPTTAPTPKPTSVPTLESTPEPSVSPVQSTPVPTTSKPSKKPTGVPSLAPSDEPSQMTVGPTGSSATGFTLQPIMMSSKSPTVSPSLGQVSIDGDEDITAMDSLEEINPLNLWCGVSQSDADNYCGRDGAITCPNAICPGELECFLVKKECNDEMEESYQPTSYPTHRPTSSPIKEPTLSPTQSQFVSKKDEGFIASEDVRFYCSTPNSLPNFDVICGSVVECNPGNPCPLGHFCIQYNCKQPLSDDRFCPDSYNGWYYSRDCKKYHKCDNGSVSETFDCGDGLQFDRIRNECQDENLVNKYCNGPSLGDEDEKDDTYYFTSTAVYGGTDAESDTEEATANEPTQSPHTTNAPSRSNKTNAPSFRGGLESLSPSHGPDDDLDGWLSGTLSPTSPNNQWNDWLSNNVIYDISQASAAAFGTYRLFAWQVFIASVILLTQFI